MPSMKSRLAYIILTSLGLAALPGLALAADPSPDLGRPEKAAFALIDGLFAAASAVVEHQGCHATAFFYRVTVDTFWDGSGSATLGNLTLEISESASSTKGQIYDAFAPQAGSIAYVGISNFLGTYAFDWAGSIFRGGAAMQVKGIEYENRVIADLWADSQPGPDPPLVPDIAMNGIEAITKVEYPRAKWSNELLYQRPGAADGSILLVKTRTGPDSAMPCTMTFTALVDDFGGGFQTFDGLLTIVN